MDLQLLDGFKLDGRLIVNFACDFSEDNRVLLLTETGVYVITLKCGLSSTYPTYTCKKDHFRPSTYAVCNDIGIDVNKFAYDLPQEELYECVFRYDITANLKAATAFEVTCTKGEWSPAGLIGNTSCMLALLTNLHSLGLYTTYTDENGITEYKEMLNITKEILEIIKKDFKYADKLPGAHVKFSEVKRRLAKVMPTTFTWGDMHQIDTVSYCNLFVGFKNGSIAVWRIEEIKFNCTEKPNAVCLGFYNTQMDTLCCLHWHQTKSYGGGLCMGDVTGKMSIVNIRKLNESEAYISNEIAFCTDADRVMVDKIKVMMLNKYTCIIVVRETFLSFYVLNEFGDLLDYKIHKVGKFYITGVHISDCNCYVLTFQGDLVHLELNVVNNKLSIEEKDVLFKIDASQFRTHGFFFSKNRILLGVVAYTNRLKCLPKGPPYIQVFFYNDATINPFSLTLSNETGSLESFWDCFEVLRMLCVKQKRFPWLGLDPNLNYDTLSLHQLKTLRIVAKISETICSSVPSIEEYNIKPFILLHYMVDIKLIIERMRRLFSYQKSGKQLSDFQLNSIDVQNFFLKEMVLRGVLGKANVGKQFVQEMRNVMSIANELEYPDMENCAWCGEKIIGSTCVPPHPDSRCSISMMQIPLIPVYKCPICNALAHEEVVKELNIIYCPYCDVPMDHRRYENNELNAVANDIKESLRATDNYWCTENCIKDDSISDVEDNNCEYVILSDCDDDGDKGCSSLKELYFKTMEMSIKDIAHEKDDILSKYQCDTK